MAHRSRKSTPVDYGFRLPSALDNRPLMFQEFLERIHQTIYVSATPGKWELDRSQGLLAEQVIRPTGLVDPPVEIRPSKGQMDDLMGECKARAARDERVLVTTLTNAWPRMTHYLVGMGVNARYLHSDIDTLERIAIIRALRAKEFDVLVDINLLREGLDIPEVSLVAILDADKEGFRRSAPGALIQTFGRAARNAGGQVDPGDADTVTASMKAAMDETSRRRAKQLACNQAHGIVPETIHKSLHSLSRIGTAPPRKRRRRGSWRPRPQGAGTRSPNPRPSPCPKLRPISPSSLPYLKRICAPPPATLNSNAPPICVTVSALSSRLPVCEWRIEQMGSLRPHPPGKGIAQGGLALGGERRRVKSWPAAGPEVFRFFVSGMPLLTPACFFPGKRCSLSRG